MSILSQSDIERFIFREARLQDEHSYDEWEALWTDDGIYWVPANGENTDPDYDLSIIYDNRSRIASRVRQLNSGKRHAQMPTSRLRRIVSNFELEDPVGDDVRIACNFVLVEMRRNMHRVWAGRTKYQLRTIDEQVRLARKTVILVNNEFPIDTLAFLI